MNKMFLWVIVAMVLVGGAVLFWRSNDTTNTNNTTNATPATTNTATSPGTLADLFSRSGTLACQYSYEDDNGSQEGRVYIADERVRGDFIMQANDGTTTTSHIVRDNEYHYNWGTYDDVTVGTKIKLSEFTPTGQTVEDDTTNEQTAPTLNYDFTYDFDCDSWSVDTSFFAPPTNVEFMDLSEQIEQIQELTNTSLRPAAEAQCAACNALPDEAARNACKQESNCP